ncbi:fibronectin type III domain-containing protein [Candidatus Pacearchaeota archaeon]|nr:fibronectin type III domain-containing protein [Candidatus Pacearchaeota archaeon]
MLKELRLFINKNAKMKPISLLLLFGIIFLASISLLPAPVSTTGGVCSCYSTFTSDNEWKCTASTSIYDENGDICSNDVSGYNGCIEGFKPTCGEPIGGGQPFPACQNTFCTFDGIPDATCECQQAISYPQGYTCYDYLEKISRNGGCAGFVNLPAELINNTEEYQTIFEGDIASGNTWRPHVYCYWENFIVSSCVACPKGFVWNDVTDRCDCTPSCSVAGRVSCLSENGGNICTSFNGCLADIPFTCDDGTYCPLGGTSCVACPTTSNGVCSSDECMGIDPDCGCYNNNNACGIGCDYTLDNDCNIPLNVQCAPLACDGQVNDASPSCSTIDPDSICANDGICCPHAGCLDTADCTSTSTFIYSPSGVLVSKVSKGGISSSNYIYDMFNRLASFNSPDLSEQYFYDSSGKRVKKISPGETTYYLSQGNDIIYTEEENTCSYETTCRCHGDPACDNFVDVLDVVATADVAFRNGVEVTDTGCPMARTNVNCDGFTDVLDVVAVVAVAFRNGNPATLFCNACLETPTSGTQPAPTIGTAVAGNAHVNVTWSNTGNPATYQYNLTYWNATHNLFISSATSPYRVSGLVSGVLYSFCVKAYNASGSSACSSTVSATPMSGGGVIPPFPAGVIMTPGVGHINLSWNPSSGATYYNISWRINGGALQPNILVGTNFYSHTGLSSANLYRYSMSACNGAGCSIESDGGYGDIRPLAPGSGIPATPTNFNAIGGNTHVNLSWSVSAGATSYNISWWTGANPSQYIIKNGGLTIFHQHTGLTNGVAYNYCIRAANSSGSSACSSTVSATPTSAVSVPGIPQNFGANPGPGSGEVTLSWTNPDAFATSWDVLWNYAGQPQSQFKIYSNPYIHTGLTSGFTIGYYLRACNVNNVCSDWSDPDATTPLSGVSQANICSDGTAKESCSILKPLYCNSQLELVKKCGSCGCSTGTCREDGSCLEGVAIEKGKTKTSVTAQVIKEGGKSFIGSVVGFFKKLFSSGQELTGNVITEMPSIITIKEGVKNADGTKDVEIYGNLQRSTAGIQFNVVYDAGKITNIDVFNPTTFLLYKYKIYDGKLLIGLYDSNGEKPLPFGAQKIATLRVKTSSLIYSNMINLDRIILADAQTLDKYEPVQVENKLPVFTEVIRKPKTGATGVKSSNIPLA